jgi:2-polyprenyl-3-methyl-5-hydroxy-6-metoxy-1,4-benzoquinol methylase
MGAILRKLGLARTGKVDPDHYRGEEARNYLKKRLKQEMWHREQDVVSGMLAAFPDGISVLDVAFGTGRFVDMYLAKEMRVYGIDISEDMLTTAKEALGSSYDRCHIEVGSADSLPWDDDRFDLVVCFRFFGLIPFDMARRVLAEIHRVCRGSVIIRVPVRKATAGALPPPEDSDLVQGRLLEHELEVLFAKSGFDVSGRQSVGERDEVEFMVYVLTRLARV